MYPNSHVADIVANAAISFTSHANHNSATVFPFDIILPLLFAKPFPDISKIRLFAGQNCKKLAGVSIFHT